MVVNAVSFGKRDNENNPTGGKWIGTGLGVAYGGYSAYSGYTFAKALNTDAGAKVLTSGNIDEVDKFIKNSKLDSLSKWLYSKSINLSKKVDKLDASKQQSKKMIEIFKMQAQLKKFRISPIVITGLLGLGIGAIVDHFRKKDEDD